MTQEEKAKAYDEAIRKAKITLGCCDSASIITEHTIYDIFPELKESEDERIKKEIVELIMQPTWKTEKEFNRRKELVAWLEKQGDKRELKKIEDEPLVIDEGKAEMDYCFTKMMNGEKVSPTWSEDDERICHAIICDIANDKAICKYELSKGICDEQINWLESLKERVQPNQWKPSKEQMETLEYYMLYLTDCKQKEVLFGLYDQLAKL